MDFNAATNQLMDCVTLVDVAKEAGVSHGLVRQARLDPSSPSHRSPPPGWEQAVAKLARSRAAELVALAEELES